MTRPLVFKGYGAVIQNHDEAVLADAGFKGIDICPTIFPGLRDGYNRLERTIWKGGREVYNRESPN